MIPSAPIRRAGVAVLVAVSAFVAACDSPTDPGVRKTNELNFLRAAADAPPLVTTHVSFWAKVGVDTEAEIYYRPRPGMSDSSRFLRFRLDDETLYRRPDGTFFAPGDSIQITINVVDASRLIVDMQPSGLRFNPAEPAELELYFGHTDDDIDDDGDVDSNDASIRTQLYIWKQEAAGMPWYRQATIREVEFEKVRAFVNGFTGYAIAY